MDKVPKQFKRNLRKNQKLRELKRLKWGNTKPNWRFSQISTQNWLRKTKSNILLRTNLSRRCLCCMEQITSLISHNLNKSYWMGHLLKDFCMFGSFWTILETFWIFQTSNSKNSKLLWLSISLMIRSSYIVNKISKIRN